MGSAIQIIWYVHSGNENAGGSAIYIHKDLLPEDAIVTHVITCQSRDHIVNVQSGRKNLVIVNVHFEPELTLRRLRERLRLITPHWPSYPNAVGIILGDFNICEPEEGRFNVWNQTFTDGDTGKAALFHSFFHMSSRLLDLTTLGGIPLSLGSYARCQGLIVSLLSYVWLRLVTFTATPMSLRIWGTSPLRVITRRYILSFKSRLIKENSANAFQVGCPNIPFSVLF